MDDWDSVSSPVEPQSIGDPWDAVSTTSVPQPQRPKQDVKIAISRRFVLLALAGLVIVALGSGITFTIYHASAIHTANVNATATAEMRATVSANATATALQQIYTQATSGTPMIDDPLSDNSQGYYWGVLNLGGGDTCGFTAGIYHLSMANSGYGWMYCVGRNIYLNNFAFQVQESIVKPGAGGILFGATANGYYKMEISSGGTFILYQYTQSNKQFQTLKNGSNPAIHAGLNTVNVVTLIVQNGNLYFYANNQFVVGVNLNSYTLSYSTGTFGFTAENSGQPTDIIFSNLKVWTL